MSSKSCKSCGESFSFTEHESALLQQLSPSFAETPALFPEPSKCPQCRQQRRLSFWNERNLYRRKSSASDKDIISVVSPDKPNKAYNSEEWWGDSWDPESFAMAYDPKAPFFEQLAKLRLEVPMQALAVVQCENCDFNNGLDNSRNCYFTFSSSNCEDTYYSSGSFKIKDSVDIWWSKEIELCANIFCAELLFNCLYCDRVGKSQDMIFCRDCSNCSNCFGCTNLQHKEYHIFNVPYEKEEYEATIQSFNRGSYQQIQKLIKQVEEFWITQPYEATSQDFTENSSGDLIYSSKDCQNCFATVDSENCAYLFECGRNVHCMDMDNSYDNTGNVYQALNSTGNFNCAFIEATHNCSDSYYLMECHGVSNCFGCVGLRNREYCVLNKQYSKKDYERLVPIIIKQMKAKGVWGEFFSPDLSVHGYNETEANVHFPLPQAKAKSLGFNWSTYEKPKPDISNAIKAADLPDHINDVQDDIVKSVILCEVTGEPYRITSAELNFYRKLQIPLPRRHPNQRFQDLVEKRNPRFLWERNCSKCNQKVPSTFSPERKEIIQCKDCYREEHV